jgi:hypothetical protein
MPTPIEQLLLVKTIRDRLFTLSNAKNIPKGVQLDLKAEVDALDWAFNQAREGILWEYYILVGDREYISSAIGIDTNNCDGDPYCEIFKPDWGRIRDSNLIKKIQSAFVISDGINLLPDNEYLKCIRYYGSADLNLKKYAVLIKGLAPELHSTALKDWAIDFFVKLNWEKAKKIGEER